MALVEVERYGNSIEAGMARARLEAAGIASFLFDQEMSWAGTFFQIRLMVDDDDLAEARTILGVQPR